jgi:uncharacterized protein YggE
MLLLAGSIAFSQQPRPPYVRASGTGSVSAQPDQFRLTITVQTRAATAAEAAERNATEVTRVLDRLRTLVGRDGELRTVQYSVNPEIRSNPQPAVIVAWVASNSIQATATDLTLPGRLIDAAIAAGATNVGGLQFGVKDPTPLLAEALKRAAAQARSQAESMASGLNLRVGAVLMLQENGSVIPDTRMGVGAGIAAVTPIESGLVEVRATVTMEAELVR